jgi:hypothetical protein
MQETAKEGKGIKEQQPEFKEPIDKTSAGQNRAEEENTEAITKRGKTNAALDAPK